MGFNGQSRGGIVQLRKNSEGLWCLIDAKVSAADEHKGGTENSTKDEEKPHEFAVAKSRQIAAHPGEVKTWSVKDEDEEDSKKKQLTPEEKKAEMEKAIDPGDSLPFHVKLIDFAELRKRLESMAKEHDFRFKRVCVVDGSTRSEHSNAFFMGFWWFRYICLYDTLLKNLSVDSIQGVLGHEMGHCVLMHIPKAFVMSTIQMSFIIWVIAQMLYNPKLHEALYVDTSVPENITPWIGLHVVQMAMEPLNLCVAIFMNWHTRKNEYEADAFAVQSFKERNYAVDLIRGLKGLASENKSHLNPHPLYVFMHHSHPTLQQRAEWISKLSKERDGKELKLAELGED